MSDNSVTERRLRPILDAVASRNWKQALQQCDKWQKKGEKSDRFLALKASVLVNQPDKAQIEKGKAEALQLCHRNTAVTDIEALYQLQDVLKHLSLQNEEGPKLWERAIAARPTDKDLLTTLLNGSISDGNWTSAQKAAMALRKAFPKERQYEFWNMLLCYLIHQDRSLPQKDRDLFGRLVYMLMSKSAELVTSSKDAVLTSGKEVSTPEELALLVKIYKATGHTDQALQILQSDTLGLKSRIAGLDPQFAFSQLLEVLDSSPNQDEVFATCKNLILSGSSVSEDHSEDDRIWTVLRDANGKRQITRDQRNACLELTESVYKSNPGCRAAYLAHFDLIAEQAGGTHTLDDESINLECTAYYDVFKTKPFCFTDLAKPLLLSKAITGTFLSKTESDNGSVAEKAFVLKLRHAHMSLRRNSDFETKILNFAIDAIRLHNELPKEKSESPEMILLAATALLRLSVALQNSDYKIQANYLLHRCYSLFTEYYPVAIRQVQLYLVQGQISLAMEKFATLAVKNMQWETVGHLLLTRISTTHPWPSGDISDPNNPLVAFDAGLTMLENADRSLDRAISDGLKYGSYSNIIDSIEVKDKMSRSMNRQVFTVDERRIQRLIGVPVDTALEAYPAEMVDQRDFSFLPDFGNFDGRSTFEESLSCGPLPRKTWLLASALHDHLTTYLRAELASQTAIATHTFESISKILEKINQQGESSQVELTPAESSNLTCHQLLAEALRQSKDQPVAKASAFETTIDKLKSWLLDTTPSTSKLASNGSDTATINTIPTPTWQFLHASITVLETLQTVSHFLSLQARRTKTAKPGKAITIPKDKLAELQQLVIDGEKAVYTQAKSLKDAINAPGVLGRLVDAAAGRVENEGRSSESAEAYRALAGVMEGLVDEVELEEYCGRLKDSWEDALDGVLRIKVKAIK